MKRVKKLTKEQRAKRKYNREYHKKYKKQIAKQQHGYYIKNKKRILQRDKEYRRKNRKAVLRRQRRRWRKNKVKNLEHNHWYYRTHREIILKKKKKYQRKNSKILSKRKLKYILKRLKTDLNFKLKMSLRNRIYLALKGNQKKGSAVRDLGCTIEFLKKYLEKKFNSRMMWKNWGPYWELDHKKALWKFDLTDKKQFLQAVNYKNLQPLTIPEHNKKSREEHKQRKAWLATMRINHG